MFFLENQDQEKHIQCIMKINLTKSINIFIHKAVFGLTVMILFNIKHY